MKKYLLHYKQLEPYLYTYTPQYASLCEHTSSFADDIHQMLYTTNLKNILELNMKIRQEILATQFIPE